MTNISLLTKLKYTKVFIFLFILGLNGACSQLSMQASASTNTQQVISSTVAKNIATRTLFIIVQDGKWGLMDKAGQVVVKPQFDYIGDFNEGLARIVVGNKFGFINKTGQIVIKPKFDHALSFKEGLALIIVNNKFGFINKSGQIVTKQMFHRPPLF